MVDKSRDREVIIMGKERRERSKLKRTQASIKVGTNTDI